MPELPEVETMRRGIAPVVGYRIAAVERPRCRLKPIAVQPDLPQFRRRTVDRRIERVGRLGKRVLVHLEGDEVIILEPRMTGLVLLADPPNREHLRLCIHLAADSATNGARVQHEANQSLSLLYWDRRGLGSVRLFSVDELNHRYNAGILGPDALEISAEGLRERLGSSRREIKVALLDQKAVAGIGNLYASEILFLARIHPRRPCHTLRKSDWTKLHAAMCEVLEEAIHYEGSTLGDGTYRNALNQQGSYQNHHRVYARAGKNCPRCGRDSIVRTVQAQRATFHCTRCQREGNWG